MFERILIQLSIISVVLVCLVNSTELSELSEEQKKREFIKYEENLVKPRIFQLTPEEVLDNLKAINELNVRWQESIIRGKSTCEELIELSEINEEKCNILDLNQFDILKYRFAGIPYTPIKNYIDHYLIKQFECCLPKLTKKLLDKVDALPTVLKEKMEIFMKTFNKGKRAKLPLSWNVIADSVVAFLESREGVNMKEIANMNIKTGEEALAKVMDDEIIGSCKTIRYGLKPMNLIFLDQGMHLVDDESYKWAMANKVCIELTNFAEDWVLNVHNSLLWKYRKMDPRAWAKWTVDFW